MPSFMQAEGAKEVGIEFHSLSKTYNMTGWRIGWIVGNKEAIEIMGRFKSNVDSGVFQPVQYAAIEALSGPQDSVSKMKMIYQERRDEAIKGLERMGWKIDNPRASFYLWAKVPPEFTSDSFAEYILEKSSVVITPGNGYGKHGEGYFRIALTADKARIAEAFERMYSVLGKVSF
jgi:LL-diaminopimelate aminotransferase